LLRARSASPLGAATPGKCRIFWARSEVGEDEDRFPILNIDLCGIDWVVDACNNVYNVRPLVTREQVADVMEEIGFGNSERGTGKDRAADAGMKMTTYSGGWKVKMQLCAATLVKAHILNFKRRKKEKRFVWILF